MAKKKAYEINRNEYNRIKKLDHSSMEEYMAAVYEKGLAAGMKMAPSFDTNMAMEAIGQIKGIGTVKLQQIELALIAAGAKR